MAGLAGTFLIGRAPAGAACISTLAAIPLIMAGVALALAALRSARLASPPSCSPSGASSAPPPRWRGGSGSTRTLPEDAEAGGGLMVAVIQLAITLGAIIGGLVLDVQGPVAAFAISAAILALAAAAAWFGSEHAK